MNIVRGTRNRKYVTDPRAWAFDVGTDYLLVPSVTTALITAGTAGQVLSEFGWTTTSLTHATPSGADFMTSVDVGTPNGFLTDASGDILKSPTIFGDYNHARAVQQILGYFPTSLTLEAGATFTVASANENQSAFGWLEDGGTASVANDQIAAIFSDGTNFTIKNDTDSDVGALIDTSYHVWKIVINPGTTDKVEWFIDGTSQGTMDLKEDEWPASFFMHSLTTNRIHLSWAHIYYR